MTIKIPWWIFGLIAVLYCFAFRLDVMDIDASQYAEMSREMAKSNNWLQVFYHGHDYLDKPPFLFWVTALSIKAFGATNFAYRLPSVAFALLAIYATYRLAKLLYNETLGRMAALVLASCQGLFLWTNDVRTDTILMSCVITAIWCIRETELRRRWQYVLSGTLAIACGMMTKGPIALFVPLFAFGADWVLRRKWRLLFSPWHLLDAAIIAVLLIPMCIGLYQQFDLHPEKLIDGQAHTSGLKFFFWTQSFGRITGENSWNNGADPSFLLSSMSWAFLPWILLFLTALFINVRKLFAQKFRLHEGQEWVSTGGFLLTYLSLCLSKYQLPHYIFVAFPLAAIVVAKLLYDIILAGIFPRLFKIFSGIQIGIGILLFVGVFLILTIVFPAGWVGILLWVGALAIWLAVLIKRNLNGKILWASVAAILLVNIFLTNHFYYNLLQYQCGSVVGKYIRRQGILPSKVYAWQMVDPIECIDYYADGAIAGKNFVSPPGKSGDYLLLLQKNLGSLDSANRTYTILKSGKLFKASELTPTFLNAKTRDCATTAYCLVLLR